MMNDQIDADTNDAHQTLEAPDAAGIEPDPKDKRAREVSSIQFPYVDLEAAIEVARAIHDAGAVPLAKDQLASHMGQAPNSGSFNQKLTAARMFGLIQTVQNRYQLTQLGFSILDSNDLRQRTARVDAFLQIPLYSKTYKEFRSRQLPPRPRGLEQTFVEFGVAPKQKNKARQVFDRSARQAGFFEHGQEQLVEPVVKRGAGQPIDEKPPTPKQEEPKTPKALPRDDGRHMLIDGLIQTLPEPGAPWSAEEQAQWLEAAARIFPLIFKTDRGTVTVSWQPGPKTDGDQESSR